MQIAEIARLELLKDNLRIVECEYPEGKTPHV